MKKLVLLCTILLATGTIGSRAQTILGLTWDEHVIAFDAIAPSQVVDTIVVKHSPDERLLAMDIRPSTGTLYVLTILGSSYYIHEVDLTTREQTGLVMILSDLDLGEGHVAFDFNPVVDRIRIVGTSGKSYRVNPITGEVFTDNDVSYATGDVNVGKVPAVQAVAYTNSYIASDLTTLYAYDRDLNVIATMNPPNAGFLNTVGPTTVTFEQSQGRGDMDIYFDPVTRSNIAYLVTRDTSQAGDGLYLVDLTAGGTTYLGQVPTDLKDIAVRIEKPPIEPLTGRLIYLLTKTSRRLLTIDSDNPAVIRSTVTINGIHPGSSIVGLDVRPANLELYALGYDAGTHAFQLYNVNKVTGIATTIGNATSIMDLGIGDVAFDFNPIADRIRIISAQTRNNYRMNPNTGELVATDTHVAYAPTDPNAVVVPQIGSAAYTNSHRAATLTSLLAIDDSARAFVAINPPNAGSIFSIAGNFYVPTPGDKTSDIDFYYDSADGNEGFMVLNGPVMYNDDLYRLSETGTAELVGPIGLGVPIIDMAVQLTYLPDTTTSSVADDRGLTHFTVSPLPIGEGAVLRFTPADGTETVNVYDVDGRVVYTARVDMIDGNAIIPMRSQCAGVYLVRLGDKSGLLLMQ